MQLKQNSLPVAFDLFLIGFGVIVAQLGNYVIAISYNIDLWWQVVQEIDKSPFNLILAYVALVGGIIIAGAGFILLFTRDKNS